MKYKKKTQTIIICILFSLIQVFSAIIICGLTGHDLFDIYLPSSRWNDEILYFKQVEGIINYGTPQGFFGYNESTAQIGTFSSWSPFLYYLYAAIGRLISWKFSTPMVINLLFMCIAFFICVKPSLPNLVYISLFYFVLLPIQKYILSEVFEALFFSLMIIFFALLFLLDNKKTDKSKSTLFLFLVIHFIILILSLLRGYYIILILPCIAVRFKGNELRKLRFLLFEGLFCAITLFLYLLINKLFCAPYFSPLIDFSWLETIFEHPRSGMINLFNIIIDGMAKCFETLFSKTIYGNETGGAYTIFFLSILFLLIQGIKKKKGYIYFSLLICQIIIFLSMILLYDVYVGRRHLLPITLASVIFVLSQGKTWLKNIFGISTIALIIALFWIISDGYLYKSIPYYSAQRENEIIQLHSSLVDNIVIRIRMNGTTPSSGY